MCFRCCTTASEMQVASLSGRPRVGRRATVFRFAATRYSGNLSSVLGVAAFAKVLAALAEKTYKGLAGSETRLPEGLYGRYQ